MGVESAIVVVLRMPPGGMTPGREGTYLSRARAMYTRAEALGGRLVAWSAALVGVAWDPESMEEVVMLAASVREESLSPERAWACGMAEGALEALSPDGARMHLAWGDALLRAASLARVARAGEVLVDGDVRALRAGQLSLVGARAATDAGQRVRGWKLDLERPWKRAGAEPGPETVTRAVLPDLTDRFEALPEAAALPTALADALEPELESELDPDDGAGATMETQALDFLGDEASTSEILEIVEGRSLPSAPPVSRRQGLGPLAAERVRRLATGEGGADPVEVLSQLRRARADAEGAPPAARCQAALALAMALTLGGRSDEALLEALDALARAREAGDAKAVGACLALLAKLYAGAGRSGEAAALREAAGVA